MGCFESHVEFANLGKGCVVFFSNNSQLLLIHIFLLQNEHTMSILTQSFKLTSFSSIQNLKSILVVGVKIINHDRD